MDFIASQIFFYLKKDTDNAILSFESSDGVTVPFFSSVDTAREFLEQARIRGHGIDMISPTEFGAFADACKAAGAKYLQLDPMADVFKTAKLKSL
ncbi:MAG: hypothetical protein RMM17_09645 [Acidobacteriota bacterium]|nr:hypothetical protein [Blastocatellia bacterium]MDW8412931.1 hypothetical protein [Acidobacteriota bacterium]